MSGKVADVGIAADRIIMSRCTCCSLFDRRTSVLITHLVYSPESVESAYLLGIHCWEYEMLQEAGGEFVAISVSVPYSHPVQNLPDLRFFFDLALSPPQTPTRNRS